MTPRRLNIYRCERGHAILSEDLDEGVTPFMILCPRAGCRRDAYSSFYELPPGYDRTRPAEVEWYKPTKAATKRLSRAMREHVRLGGLVMRERPAPEREP